MQPSSSAGASGANTAGTGVAGSSAGRSGSAGIPATGVSGTSGAAGASSVAGSGGAAGADATPDAGASDDDAGVLPGAGSAAAGGGAAGDAAAGSGAAGAGADPTAGLMQGCLSGSVEACGSFKTSSGTDIQLGPYGSIMEPNVGQGFENAVASGDSDGGLTCELFAASFGSDPMATAALLETGDLNFALYTVYRPAIFKEGEKYPVLSWGNGTCAQPEGYSALLRYIASHGFVIVAANSRWVGSGDALVKGLDFILAKNDDSASPYYQKIDATKVGVMGHSQGSQGTAAAARDSRVVAAILFNGGQSLSKPFLAVSGERDIGMPTEDTMSSGLAGASSSKGAYLYYRMIPMEGNAPGHLTLMQQPERVTEASTAWWKYILQQDAASKDFFVGTSCKLCGRDAEFGFGAKGLE